VCFAYLDERVSLEHASDGRKERGRARERKGHTLRPPLLKVAAASCVEIARGRVA
jgi:hypothetical protein